ncbi:MAG TPA: inositol monophosphatase family protein, partial [Longimicrobiales bacterium]
MHEEPLRDLLDFAVDIAWRAGRLTLAHFQTGIAVETKSDESPVTLADREAERLLRAAIEARFPADGIVGEEFG